MCKTKKVTYKLKKKIELKEHSVTCIIDPPA